MSSLSKSVLLPPSVVMSTEAEVVGWSDDCGLVDSIVVSGRGKTGGGGRRVGSKSVSDGRGEQSAPEIHQYIEYQLKS